MQMMKTKKCMCYSCLMNAERNIEAGEYVAVRDTARLAEGMHPLKGAAVSPLWRALLVVHFSGESSAAKALCCGMKLPGEGLGLEISALTAGVAAGVLLCSGTPLLGDGVGLRLSVYTAGRTRASC